MFHRIVVAVDGSAHAAAALKQAIDIAWAQQASLTLITAWQPFNYAYAGAGMGLAPPIEDGQAVTAGIKADARLVLDAAAKTVPAEISVEAHLLEGHPTEVILEAVHNGAHDLIAIGSRGRGGISTLLLGSVSHSLIQHSAVPVLVVHLPSASRASAPGRDESTAATRKPVIASHKKAK
ncbi:MAG: universal stress protein [Candidatus Dormibacter sp.]